MSVIAMARFLCGGLLAATMMTSMVQLAEGQVPTEFVRVDGLHFVVGNERFYFVGTNNYYLHQFALSSSGQARVLEVLDESRDVGLTVLRMWAYSEKFGSNALQPGPYQLNERVAEAMDWVIYQAGLRGIRMILTLTDNWDHYGGIDYYLPWSSTAYSHNDFFTDYTVKDIFKAYFNNLATRVNVYTNIEYRNDPRIFCWELINEPRLSDSSGNILQNWIEEMGAYIKSVDSNHMLSVGEEGFFGASDPDYFQYNPGGWVTSTGSDFIRNHQPDTIDFASAHVWVNAWLGNSGSLSASAKVDWVINTWVAGHLKACNEILKKPFIMGEFGLPQPLSERDLLYDGMYKIFEDEARGDLAGAGTVFWLLQDNAYPDFDGNAVYFPDHPSTYALIKAHSDFMNSFKPSLAPIPPSPPSPPSPPPMPPAPPSPPYVGPTEPELGFALFENSFPSGWEEGSWTGGFSVVSVGNETHAIQIQVDGWGAFTFQSLDIPSSGSNAFSSALYGEASNEPVALSVWMHMPSHSSRGVQVGMFPGSVSSPEWSTFLWNPSSGESTATSGKSISEVEEDLTNGWVHFMVDLTPALSSGTPWSRLYFKGFDPSGVVFYLDKIWLVAPDAELDPTVFPFAAPGGVPVVADESPSASATASRLSSPPLSIMPIGDSITAGWPIPGGYREKLFQDLRDLSLDPDMQGSLRDNCGSVLQDCDHEGHGGWRIDQIASSLPQFLPLPASPNTDPDIVLLMLGTNDMGQNYFIDQAPERLRNLIDDILMRRPACVVIVATIPPFSGEWNNVNQVEPFNAQITNYVVPSFNSPQVRLVDIYNRLNKDADLADAVHPNKVGADKVADVWRDEIIRVLEEFSSSPMSLPPPSPMQSPPPSPMPSPPPSPILPPPSPMPPSLESPEELTPPLEPPAPAPEPVVLLCTPVGAPEGAPSPSLYVISPEGIPVPVSDSTPVDEEASEEIEDIDENTDENVDEIDEEDEETQDETKG